MGWYLPLSTPPLSNRCLAPDSRGVQSSARPTAPTAACIHIPALPDQTKVLWLARYSD
jgi:hypothetical protein